MAKDTTEDEEKTKPDPSSEDDDEDDDMEEEDDDPSEDDDEEDESTKKGVEQEVAVIDGDEVMAALAETVEKAIGDCFPLAVEQAVAAVLADKDYQEKQRAMAAGQINKALDLRIGALNKAAEALTKAIEIGDALQKGIASDAEEIAKNTPALKTVSEEVLDKGINTGGIPAASPVDVSALMKEGLDLQMQKGIRIELLSDYSMLGVAEKHDPKNVAKLQKAIADARG